MSIFAKMFSPQEVTVHGSVAEGLEPVKELFQEQFNKGEELSAQVCVYLKGQKVVDLAGSSVDPAYDADSLQTIWSSTKNLTALAMACLVDRGLLSYSDKVTKHWPEFGAQEGKELITVADVMRHEGGMPQFNQQLDIEDSFPENIARNGVGRVIQEETPCWPESDKREYHAITRGFVAQEIFRRVEPSGRTIGQFLREEVLGPLGAEVFIGLSEQEQRKRHIANVEAPSDKDVEETAGKQGRSDVMEALKKFRAYEGETEGKRKEHKDTWKQGDAISFWNTTACRRAEIPSAGGLASARGLAKVAGMLAAEGKADGKTFLGEAGFRAMHDLPTEGWTFGMHTFYTQGGVNFYKDGRVEKGDAVKAGRDGMIHYGQLVPRGLYGWGGYGGSVFLWDREKQLGFVYIPTYLAWYDRKKERATNLLSTLYSCLED